ncbi:MAG TPA: TerD family protein [Jatrophihabitantaceae bacterium]|jgi:tellurium resistance protein TerD|nr:TerD family protein [Jatrophihabitantaceae bacterium]
MAVMRRGANVSLSREIPGLRRLAMGVKWDAGSETALADNLVMAAVLCDEHGKALSDEHFVFFNQLASPDLSVHELDEALGTDHEQVEIDLAAVPAGVDRIVSVLYINDGPAQRRTLGQLRTCVVRVLNADGNQELVASEDLAAAFTSETAVVLGEVYRHNGEWKFKVLGQGYANGLAGIATDYGLSL